MSRIQAANVFSRLIMKRWLIGCMLLALVLSLASAFFVRSVLPAAHAAGPLLAISPTSGAYSNRDDQTPISVHGRHFGAHEAVNVYWNYTAQNDGTLVTTATTDSKGVFSAIFDGVLSAYGTYTIAGIGQTSGLVGTGTYTLYPQLYIRPQAGGPYSVTTFYGNAFGAGETVNLYWQYHGAGTGTFLASAVANATGSFSVTVPIPATNPGYYNVGAVGQTTNTIATYTYTLYQPTFMLAPVSGAARSTVTISGFGFTGSENVAIYWHNRTTPLTILPTTPYGYLAPTTIIVPPGIAPGVYAVKAVGQSSHISIATMFTLLALASSLSVTSGPVGVSVAVTGQGYPPNKKVNVIWGYDGPGTGTTVAQTTANKAGSIQASFLAPDTAPGSYQVAVQSAATQTITQNTFTLSDSIAASPDTATPGQQVIVTGSGFQANEAVDIYWDSTVNNALATATADANGNINQAITVPALATPGSHSLIAVGRTSGLSFTTPIATDTNWGDFGFDNAHHRENIHEYLLGAGNVANLQLEWTAQTKTGLKDSPVYANGLVYIGSMDGNLDAYNATSGQLQWQFDCECIFRSYSSPLVDPANNLVFFGTVGHSNEGIPSPIYALDAQTGQLRWSEILPWETVGFPTVAFNTIYLGTSHIDHNNCALIALDELTGAIDWQYTVNAGVWGAVAADTSDNTIITGVGNPFAAVIAFNATTGAVIWQYTVPQYGPDDDVGSGITIANEFVYASSKNGSVYALNESDGSLVWSTPISHESAGDISTQAVAANGMLYIGSISGNLFALDAATGRILWKVSIGKRLYSSPAVANGVVYIASFNDNLYAVNATSGAVLWTYSMGGPSYSSPIVVNGWLYCGASDGLLYAFSL